MRQPRRREGRTPRPALRRGPWYPAQIHGRAPPLSPPIKPDGLSTAPSKRSVIARVTRVMHKPPDQQTHPTPQTKSPGEREPIRHMPSRRGAGREPRGGFVTGRRGRCPQRSRSRGRGDRTEANTRSAPTWRREQAERRWRLPRGAAAVSQSRTGLFPVTSHF